MKKQQRGKKSNKTQNKTTNQSQNQRSQNIITNSAAVLNPGRQTMQLQRSTQASSHCARNIPAHCQQARQQNKQARMRQNLVQKQRQPKTSKNTASHRNKLSKNNLFQF